MSAAAPSCCCWSVLLTWQRLCVAASSNMCVVMYSNTSCVSLLRGCSQDLNPIEVLLALPPTMPVHSDVDIYTVSVTQCVAQRSVWGSVC